MQRVRCGTRVLLSRTQSCASTWKFGSTGVPSYLRAAETKEPEHKNMDQERSLARALLGRRDYTQFAYSPATYLDKKDVTDRVLEVLRSCPQVDPSKVGPLAHFEKDINLDILDTVEIMLAMEEEFALDIPNTVADKMVSCADIINYVAAHPQAK